MTLVAVILLVIAVIVALEHNHRRNFNGRPDNLAGSFEPVDRDEQRRAQELVARGAPNPNSYPRDPRAHHPNPRIHPARAH